MDEFYRDTNIHQICRFIKKRYKCLAWTMSQREYRQKVISSEINSRYIVLTEHPSILFVVINKRIIIFCIDDGKSNYMNKKIINEVNDLGWPGFIVETVDDVKIGMELLFKATTLSNLAKEI